MRGDYKGRILDWINDKHPELNELYRTIYTKKDRSYWYNLDKELREFCTNEGLPYVRDDDSKRAKFGEPPIVANYFFHEEVVKSAKI